MAHMKTFTAKAVTGLCLSLLTGGGLICYSMEVAVAETAERTPDRAKKAERQRAKAAMPRHRQQGQHGGSRVPRGTGLNEKIIAHSDAANVRNLIKFLAPRGWRVHFDVAASRVDRALVFHAETTRRQALDRLCSSLGLKGIFYPRKRLVLIVEGRPS